MTGGASIVRNAEATLLRMPPSMRESELKRKRGGFLTRFAFATLLPLATLLSGCAYGLVRHHFSFNALEEPGIEVLDYRYGNSRQPSARADHSQLRDGKVRQVVRMSGDIPRPTLLYVRWRVESSGTDYEDAVNLDRLLPRDITDHRINFKVRDAQLFVYLVSPGGRGANDVGLLMREFPYNEVNLLSNNFGRPVARDVGGQTQ